MLPCSSHCTQCCNERWGACVFFNYGFSQRICSAEGLLGHMIVFFLSFLRNLHTLFHSVCINLHSHQQCKSVPFSSHPFQHLLFVDSFDNGHCDRCEAVPTVVLMCFSLIISNVEHLFFTCLCLLRRNVCLGFLPVFWW